MKCPDCDREFERKNQLMMHRVSKHGYKKPAAEPQPESQPVKGEYAESPDYAAKKAQTEMQEEPEQPQQEQQPDLLEKMKALGIEPEQVMAALSPLVETAVVQTLEKMQLGEAINKKVAEVETKLSGQIKQTLKPLQQVATSRPSAQPSGGGDNQPQNTQLRDQVLPLIIQKLLNPNSGGNSLEQLTKMLDMARAVSDAFNKPALEAQAYTRREISDTLKMLRDAGATPDVARDTLIKRTEG